MRVRFRTILACAAMILLTVRPCMRAHAGAGNPSFVCNTSMFPTNVREKVASRLRQAIGGGQVQNGPFTFCVFLYADPQVQPNAEHPSLMTSIPGVGWSALWVYHGANIRENTIESYGLAPDQVTPKAGYSSLQRGDWGGRFGGGVPESKDSRPGDRVRLGIQMDTPEGAYGAEIAFTTTGKGVSDITAYPSHQ